MSSLDNQVQSCGDGKNLSDVIEIDGSYGEGGGEILRNCIAYSTILRKPIRVSKIRAGRPKPGLRPQHLHGILLAQKLCSADTLGCSENSTEVDYFPNALTGGSCVADTKTAGSVTLLMQTALPCMLFANRPCHVTLKVNSWQLKFESVRNLLKMLFSDLVEYT